MEQPLDIGKTLQLGWEGFSRNALALIVDLIIVSVVSTVTLGICAGPMTIGYNAMCLRAARGETVAVGESLKGFGQFGPSFMLMLIAVVAIVVGLILCIIPGLVIGFMWFWSTWLMADGNNDPMACFRGSADFVKQNAGPVVIFVIVASVINAIGGAIGGFGSLITAPIALMMIAQGYLRAFAPNPAAASY